MSGPDFCLSSGCFALRFDWGRQGKDLLSPVPFPEPAPRRIGEG